MNQTRSKVEQEISSLKEEIQKSQEKNQQQKDSIIYNLIKKKYIRVVIKFTGDQEIINRIGSRIGSQIKINDNLRDKMKELYQEIEKKNLEIENIKYSKDAQLIEMNKSEREWIDQINALENEIKKIKQDGKKIRSQLQLENQIKKKNFYFRRYKNLIKIQKIYLKIQIKKLRNYKLKKKEELKQLRELKKMHLQTQEMLFSKICKILLTFYQIKIL
ncbi:unnamed protein product [Paramecium sonneborni]|uniref:Uncharacterized protein n=1 Tax=Paramecium sonneborni TaxID=65129 RepID=A0A8S1PAY0_9CILI|nr:unnamed protein product [Paramecium sonneborni]